MDFDDIESAPLRLVASGGERLDAFLGSELAEYSRSKLVKAIAAGDVTVGGVVVVKASTKLKPGDVVELTVPEVTPAHDLEPFEMDLNVVFEDDFLLVVDKPRGLAVHPAATLREPSLVNALLARGGPLSSHGGRFRPGIVHRLDKETTGLIAVAKTDTAHMELSRQFESKSAERRYLGVIAGEPDRHRFDVDAPISRDPKNRQRMAVVVEGKPSLTHCLVLGPAGPGTLMAFRLATGRTHQIRVHMRAIGHPILGDATYAPPSLQTCPLQLHAAYLAFDHPSTGKRVETHARPPADFLGFDQWRTDIFASFDEDRMS